MADVFELLSKAVFEGEIEDAEDLAKKALSEGLDPLSVIEKGCVDGIEKAGDLFAKGEYFLPELVAAAEAMKAAMAILEPALSEQKGERKSLGRVVLGTVHGDIHDIGKSIVGSMLSAAGFSVYDLGVDVSNETFVNKVREVSADILGLSALLTTTMPRQQEIIEMLRAQGLRDKVKVIVGGAPVTQEWADKCGADAFAEDAIRAVQVAKSLTGN
ncbi:MAG: corrinoid protein [Bacillota bacterium]